MPSSAPGGASSRKVCRRVERRKKVGRWPNFLDLLQNCIQERFDPSVFFRACVFCFCGTAFLPVLSFFVKPVRTQLFERIFILRPAVLFSPFPSWM